MKPLKILPLIIPSLAIGFASGSFAKDPKAAHTIENNQVFAPWTGPYQGVPAFDKVKLSELKPALEQGMAKNMAEIEAIANNPEAPTFANTLEAYEAAGKDLDRVFTYWTIWSSNMSSPEFREIRSEMSPKISAFYSKITQNKKLFARIKAVYESDAMKNLRPDQQRLLEKTYLGFKRSGAELTGEKAKRYSEINQRLSQLQNQFSNNVLADEEGYVTFFSKDQSAGLPESYLSAAASSAKAKGKEGQYAVSNTRSSMSPFLTYADNRELRKQVWTNYYSRGDNGGEHDNNAIIAEILKLRHERVGLLGYKDYASWQLESRMAGKPENAMKLMEAVWPAAIARVDEEIADMLEIAKADGVKNIEPWDYRYYAEKVRKAKYDLNSDEVKQYLQLGKLRDAMFYVADRLFNFKFTAVAEGTVPVFHPDVKVWEVTDKTTGKHIGLWYLDPFARKGKRSGAWAVSYRSHTDFQGKTNVLSSNNSNFVKGEPGQPVLISWDDAETYFHEFGHALHALSSNVAYPSQNRGVRDYTEFQSQLLEHWLSTDEVIDKYLRHYKTGEPMPAELIAKIKKAASFNEGFGTTEYLASALIDMKLHSVDPSNIDPDKFERETLAKMNMPSAIVMRHRTPHFSHIFSSEGYAASYYGYLWAEVLTADAAEAFANAPGGFYDKAMAKKLVDHLFSVRDAVPPAEAYVKFRGREANIEALMRLRNFPIPKNN
ncbi:M3 family metallopeptidase [Pseudoteredinibacter isoporae]|nr:M3 family metallopeptidase [Pseudoteredinibacter isoporae]NHO86401.1 M3 family metallopeptidase [Pseudoteredinibacter isoporae]NIB25147.1 M3 family metallopeptidase [Pseudoteredinibacter isoporae]